MNFNYYVETMKLDADKMQQNLNTFGVNIAARLDQGWVAAGGITVAKGRAYQALIWQPRGLRGGKTRSAKRSGRAQTRRRR